MGYIQEAKKRGLFPERESSPKKRDKKLGGIVIDSAEGTRLAYSAIPLPHAENETLSPVRQSRLRNILGRILPQIDRVVHREDYWMNGYWETERTHQSGRVSRTNRLQGAIFIPTAEWVDPYSELSEEEKQQMVAQFEIPPFPGEVEHD